jgi:hypothetical protein
VLICILEPTEHSFAPGKLSVEIEVRAVPYPGAPSETEFSKMKKISVPWNLWLSVKAQKIGSIWVYDG